jgi:hypothetical protein
MASIISRNTTGAQNSDNTEPAILEVISPEISTHAVGRLECLLTNDFSAPHQESLAKTPCFPGPASVRSVPTHLGHTIDSRGIWGGPVAAPLVGVPNSPDSWIAFGIAGGSVLGGMILFMLIYCLIKRCKRSLAERKERKREEERRRRCPWRGTLNPEREGLNPPDEGLAGYFLRGVGHTNVSAEHAAVSIEHHNWMRPRGPPIDELPRYPSPIYSSSPGVMDEEGRREPRRVVGVYW